MDTAMPGDGYDRDREDFRNNDRGRIWENGTDRFFRDRENGYDKPPQSRQYWTPEGYRRYDKERVDDKGHVRGVEDKSGSMTGDNDRKELEKDRFLLERGIVDHLVLRTVEGEPKSKEVRELIDGLARDYPDKFTHQIISRCDAREIWARGLEREPSPQLELPSVGEQARLQKERQREAREQAAREARLHVQPAQKKEPQQRERENPAKSEALEREPLDPHARESERDKTKPPAVASERPEPTPKAREVREREEAQAREMVDRLGGYLSDPQKEQVLAVLRQERDNERKDIALELKPPRGQEPPTPPPIPQRTPQHEHENALTRAIQERNNARAAAKEAGLSREIMGILGLNSDDPPKMIDVDHAGMHAESEREHSIHQKRERERSEREREGRHRSG
ncbi:hypothetical protein ACQP2U_29690 [Nocardia sp. CA-084685]|uniref:hypothetical protein n=1 Tax=Nocardia sp. CA-084685 TaxID=3239970 RepID=UPI003D99C64B